MIIILALTLFILCVLFYVVMEEENTNSYVLGITMICTLVLGALSVSLYNEYTQLKNNSEGKCPELEKVENVYIVK